MGIEQSVESVIINNTEVICNVLEDEIFATSKNLSNRKAAPRNRDKCYAIKEMDNLTEYVILQCIKEKNKLRMKILTNSYYTNANCQCPKNIRIAKIRSIC